MRETKLPVPLSEGEETFNLHCQINRLYPEREYAFALPRRWRFDFYFLAERVAVEIEGGYMGRHQRQPGFESDIHKYNCAATHLAALQVRSRAPEEGTPSNSSLALFQPLT
jgi:hypothetical protein